MSRFFFDIRSPQSDFPDGEGFELADSKEARLHAMAVASEMVREEVLVGDPKMYWMEVRDKDGCLVWIMPMSGQLN